MSVITYWSPSADPQATGYLLQRAPASTGSWAEAANVAHDLTGSDYDPVSNQFTWTDASGTDLTWYRVAVLVGASTGTFSAPWQPAGLTQPGLCTVADVQLYAGLPTGSEAVLQMCIEQASSFIERQVGYSFRSQLFSREFDGDGGRVLPLPLGAPVLRVLSVVVDGTPLAQSAGPAAEGWFFQDGCVRLRSLRFTEGEGNVSVAWEAGYPEVPYAVRGAAIELAVQKFRDRTRIGTSSESVSGMSVSYLPSVVPQSVKDVVDAYRRPL